MTTTRSGAPLAMDGEGRCRKLTSSVRSARQPFGAFPPLGGAARVAELLERVGGEKIRGTSGLRARHPFQRRVAVGVAAGEIGRASCRERGWIWVVAVACTDSRT